MWDCDRMDIFSGIIYIAPVPYTGPIIYEIGSPAVLACVAGLSEPISVPDFQSAAQSFVGLCSEINHAFLFALYQMCLDNAILHSVEATGHLASRTQDEKGLL
ncbi:hypothetical protein BD779DRAFT_1534468 [Infundibulicybe gibba]|nr:hypothetical protein BD779DRAFT_1534468 [Infundibulicybe gibba]